MANKNILKHLRNIEDVFLIYGDANLIVSGYTDTIFQYDRDDFKSQSSYVFTMNDGTVSWKSSKQEMTGGSVTESEYIIASDGSLGSGLVKVVHL